MKTFRLVYLLFVALAVAAPAMASGAKDACKAGMGGEPIPGSTHSLSNAIRRLNIETATLDLGEVQPGDAFVLKLKGSRKPVVGVLRGLEYGGMDTKVPDLEFYAADSTRNGYMVFPASSLAGASIGKVEPTAKTRSILQRLKQRAGPSAVETNEPFTDLTKLGIPEVEFRAITAKDGGIAIPGVRPGDFIEFDITYRDDLPNSRQWRHRTIRGRFIRFAYEITEGHRQGGPSSTSYAVVVATPAQGPAGYSLQIIDNGVIRKVP